MAYLGFMSVTWSVECDTPPEAVASVLKLGPSRPNVHVKPKRRIMRDKFIQLCVDYPEVQAELLPDGTLELMSPLVFDSGRKENRVSGLLFVWWMKSRLDESQDPAA